MSLFLSGEQLNKILASPEVEAVVEKKLAELSTRPEGAMFAMMVITRSFAHLELVGCQSCNAKAYYYAICDWNGNRTFSIGKCKNSTCLTPLKLGKNFDPTQFISIGRIRTELDDLMTTKLEGLNCFRMCLSILELTPDTVKRVIVKNLAVFLIM